MRPAFLIFSAFFLIIYSVCSPVAKAGDEPELTITDEWPEIDKLELYDLEYIYYGYHEPSIWPPTRIDMTGGHVGQYDDPGSGVYTYESSTFNMSGGVVDYLHAFGSSTVKISGGVVSNYDCYDTYSISANNSSTVNVYNGALLSGGSSHIFDLYDSSTVNIHGGDVAIILVAHDSSTVNLFNGDCRFGIFPYGYSTTNIYGGYVESYLGEVFVPGISTTSVNIYGHNFNYDPEALWLYWEDPCDGWWLSKLTGFGANGTAITFWGLEDPSTHSNVNLIPDFVMERGVDFADYSAFASAWRTQAGSSGWNHIYDISDPNDDVIDERDLAVFVEYWLAGK